MKKLTFGLVALMAVAASADCHGRGRGRGHHGYNPGYYSAPVVRYNNYCPPPRPVYYQQVPVQVPVYQAYPCPQPYVYNSGYYPQGYYSRNNNIEAAIGVQVLQGIVNSGVFNR